MQCFRRRVALTCALEPCLHRKTAHACEPLEPRRLLDANDPVLVLVEPVQDYRVGDVAPYLWHSPVETCSIHKSTDSRPRIIKIETVTGTPTTLMAGILVTALMAHRNGRFRIPPTDTAPSLPPRH